MSDWQGRNRPKDRVLLPKKLFLSNTISSNILTKCVIFFLEYKCKSNWKYFFQILRSAIFGPKVIIFIICFRFRAQLAESKNLFWFTRIWKFNRIAVKFLFPQTLVINTSLSSTPQKHATKNEFTRSIYNVRQCECQHQFGNHNLNLIELLWLDEGGRRRGPWVIW